ncbi:MAG: hypothetical protein AB4426_02180 [Xenococcaceae cyanobacterium]
MTTTQWQYLEKRSHPWRQQLYIKGRKLRAFTLWVNMNVNEMTPSQAADNWELPLVAIHEVIEYCSKERELLKREAEEERRRLEAV